MAARRLRLSRRRAPLRRRGAAESARDARHRRVHVPQLGGPRDVGVGPAFLAACFVAGGSDLTRGAGLGAYVSALLHATAIGVSLVAGMFADRFGRTSVMLAMAS